MAHQPPSSGRFIAGFCLIAGLVIGLLLGRHGRSPGESASPRSTGSEKTEAAFAHSNELRDTRLEAVATDKPPATSAIEHLRKLANGGPPYDMELALRSARELSKTVECREVMELFRRWPSEERQVLQGAIARRWAGLDPDGALRESLRSPNDDFHRLLVEEAARELVRRDPDAALAGLSDPMTALQRVILGHFMLPALAEKNPANAAAFLAANKEFMVDDDMFGNVGRLWARENPKDALAWAMALPQGRAQGKALQEIWTTWSVHDPVAVAAEISRNADGKVGLQVFGAVAQAWSRTDPRAALEWIAGLSPTRADEALRAFSLDVRKLGVESTLGLINSIKSESQQARLAGEVAAQLAADDPAAAIAWAERLPKGALRDQALRPALDEWARTEPVQAVAYAAALKAGNARSELLRRAVAGWAGQDMGAAMTWTRQMSAGKERDAVASAAADQIRRLDPAKASQWLDMIQAPDKREGFISDIAGEWGRLDGAAAMKWLSQLPDAATQTQGHRALARQWALYGDSEATAGWISSLPAGTARDAAIGAFVESVDGHNPGLATAWATAIEDPKDREKNVRSAFGRWLERDAAQARLWLNDAKLDDSLRAELARAPAKR